MRAVSPIEMMIAAAMVCTICGAKAGTCDCWEKCECGWSYRKGGGCRNTVHICEAVAGDVAARVLEKLSAVKISTKASRAVEASVYEAVFDWATEFLEPPEKAKK